MMTRTFPPAQPRHFAAMLSKPNNAKTFVVVEKGMLVREPYLYSMLRREETEMALFVQKMRNYTEIVSFYVAELKDYRLRNK